MSARVNGLLLRLAAVASIMIIPCGCAVGYGDGYGYDGSVGIGVDYYEPYGFDYGGWGPRYGGVAPYRNRGGEPGRGGSGGHGYRAAPASHSMPSIPSGGRSGGGRSSGQWRN